MTGSNVSNWHSAVNTLSASGSGGSRRDQRRSVREGRRLGDGVAHLGRGEQPADDDEPVRS